MRLAGTCEHNGSRVGDLQPRLSAEKNVLCEFQSGVSPLRALSTAMASAQLLACLRAAFIVLESLGGDGPGLGCPLVSTLIEDRSADAVTRKRARTVD
jgi:hypothetical protein